MEQGKLCTVRCSFWNVIAKSCGKLHYQFLVEGTQWSHIIDLSIDQLSTLSIRKRVDIFNCIVV